MARLHFRHDNGLAQQQFNATNQARIPANGIKSDSAQKFRGTTKPSNLGRITSPARHSSVSSTEGTQVCRSSKDKSAGLTRNGASIAVESAEAQKRTSDQERRIDSHQLCRSTGKENKSPSTTAESITLPRPDRSWIDRSWPDRRIPLFHHITDGSARDVLQNTFMTKGRRVVPINEYAEKL